MAEAKEGLVHELLEEVSEADYVFLPTSLSIESPTMPRDTAAIIASSPEAIRIFFPDISVSEVRRYLEDHPEVDSLVIHIRSMVKEAKERYDGLNATLVVRRGETTHTFSLHLSDPGFSSRDAIGCSDTLCIVILPQRRPGLLEKLMILDPGIALYLGGYHSEQRMHLVEETFEKYEGRGLILAYSVLSKEEMLNQTRSSVVTGEAARWLRASLMLSLFLVVLVAVKSGLSLAHASRDLVGLLRLYGASRLILVFLAASFSIIVLCIVAPAAYMVSYLFYTRFLDLGSYPLFYVVRGTWRFMALFLAGYFAGLAPSLLAYSSRRELEEFVVRG